MTTGIENVSGDSDSFDGVPEYYTIQGIRVNADQLTPGLYIVRRGQSVTKEIIR